MISSVTARRLRPSPASLALVVALGAPAALSAQVADGGSVSPPATTTAVAPVSDAAPPAATAAGIAVDDAAGEVLVTARRRQESAQDVPIALTVLSSAALNQSGNFNINQIQQLVPSMQVTAFNPRNSVITIRGLGANSSSASDGLEYGVGFYLDGVYYGRPGQSQFDLMDLEQIEVLRGPQGTLFGKNTTAGALNVTTRLPGFTPEFTGEISGGNYDFVQLRASGSAPLIADRLALRLTAAHTDRGGFLTNVFDGRDAQTYRNTTLRAQIYARATDDLTVRLIGDYSRQKQRFQLPVVAGYFSTYANGAAIPNNVFDRAARFGYTLLSPDAFRREAQVNSPFQANMSSWGVSGELNWDIGPATATAITAYRAWNWDPKNDLDATTLSIQLQGQQINRQRQFSQEFRLASNGRNTIDYVVGAYYFWQVVRGYGTNEFGADFARWNNNPAVVPAATIAANTAAFTGFRADAFADPSTKSYAVFGQTDWHIGARLTLTTGLRFTHEDKRGIFTQSWTGGIDAAALTAAQIAARTAIAPRLTFGAEDHANALTGLATLSYRIAPDVLGYATYSRGNKSGGLNLSQGGVNQPVVAPEKVDAYEIGLKSQLFDRRVTLNASAFWNDVRNYQTSIAQFITGTTSFVQYIANIPRTRSRGVEVDLRYAPTRLVGFTASGAYIDARYRDFTNSPRAPDAINQGAVVDLSGERLSNVPKFAFSVGGDAAQPLAARAFGDTLQLYGHADYAYRSSFNSTSSNSALGIIDGYGLLTLRAGLRTEAGRYDLSFFMKNALDEDYFVQLTPTNYGLVTSVLGDPRTYGGTFRVRF